MNCQEHLVINDFSKHFEGTIFTNGNRFVKFSSLKIPRYTVTCICTCVHMLCGCVHRDWCSG